MKSTKIKPLENFALFNIAQLALSKFLCSILCFNSLFGCNMHVSCQWSSVEWVRQITVCVFVCVGGGKEGIIVCMCAGG